MPAVPLTFRSVCGHFATVYASFMLKRARFSLAMRMSILRLRTRADGVTVGVLLTLLYYGNLIHRCGDVELNPGPDRKTDGTRQTLLDSVTGGTTQRHSSQSRSRKDSSRKDSVERTGSTPETLTGLPSDPSLSDVMSMLTNLFQPPVAQVTKGRNKHDLLIGSDDINQISPVKGHYVGMEMGYRVGLPLS
ncbi:hypothetical protein ACOMHN_035694 [Nucella lapillus]